MTFELRYTTVALTYQCRNLSVTNLGQRYIVDEFLYDEAVQKPLPINAGLPIA